MNNHQCEYENCTETDTTECRLVMYRKDLSWLWYLTQYGLSGLRHIWELLKFGYTDLISYYCIEHAHDSGFCGCCGNFYAGTNDYDLNKSPFCENCREDEYEEDYSEDDYYYGGYDDYYSHDEPIIEEDYEDEPPYEEEEYYEN